MGKVVGIAEFKANCTRLIAQMERDGETITVTKRGKVVGVLSPPVSEKTRPLFGLLKGMMKIHGDIVGPVLDPGWEAEWEADNPAELYDPAARGVGK